MSFLFSQPKGVVKTPYYPRGNFDFWLTLPPVSTLSTLTLPIPSPVYGIISRFPMNRIQVASDSADVFLFLGCFLDSSDPYQKFNSLLRGIKSGPWVGSNPRPSFHRGFASEELLFPVETQVFLNITINNIKYFFFRRY